MADRLSQSDWISFVRGRAADASRREPHRTEERAPAYGDVSLILDDARRSRYRATLLNISEGGIMVKNDSEIPHGSRLTIELNAIGLSRDVFGEVRHSTQTLGGHKIGIRLIWESA